MQFEFQLNRLLDIGRVQESLNDSLGPSTVVAPPEIPGPLSIEFHALPQGLSRADVRSAMRAAFQAGSAPVAKKELNPRLLRRALVKAVRGKQLTDGERAALDEAEATGG